MQEAIGEVMRLQEKYSPDDDEYMVLRRKIVTTELPNELQSYLPEMARRSGIADLRIEGRSSTGKNSLIPWVRIHSEALSPKATNGWYIALLFSSDGTRVYLSLLQGTADLVKGEFKNKPLSILQQQAAVAYDFLTRAGALPQSWRRDITLNAGRGTLGEGYENGTVAAVEYRRDLLPTDEKLLADLLDGLAALAALYEAGDELLDTEPEYETDVIDYWDPAVRDVVPGLAAKAEAGNVGAAILFGMLTSDDKDYSKPYTTVRDALKIRKKQVLPELEEQADVRIRTYKTFFRGLGLLYDQDGKLNSTEFGKGLLSILEEQYKAADDYAQAIFVEQRRRLAQLAIGPLSRYQLANPVEKAKYPPGTDIHPLRAIWSVMRKLDDRLHWEELGRVLTACLREADLLAVVDRIQQARQNPRFDLADPYVLDELLGPRKPDRGKNQSDRMDSWSSRAGFRDIFLERRDRADGYRYLNSEFIDLIDEVLEREPEFNDTDDAAEFMGWFGTVDQRPQPVDQSEREIAIRAVARCRRFGQRQIIALVGPAGTGKTKSAWEAARILADGDTTRVSTIQFHAGFTYEEFVAGLVPSGGGGFSPKLGALLEINEAAKEAPHATFVLLIDEFSRADVANVLGELLTYIEYRDRTFYVPVLDRDVSIAPNLVIIATLNPADRSVINMDDALVRRLRQVEVPRSTSALREILSAAGANPLLIEEVADWFDRLPGDAPFGHGLFVGVKDELDLYNLWQESLQYFLRRGGLLVYAEAESVERGYRWRQPQYARPPLLGLLATGLDQSFDPDEDDAAED